jgi:hypothetical protein
MFLAGERSGVQISQKQTRDENFAQMLDLRKIMYCADYVTLSNSQPLEAFPPSARLWLALERQTANNPHRRILHAAVKVRRQIAMGNEDLDAVTATPAVLWADVVIGLQRAFHFFTPARRHWRRGGLCALRIPVTALVAVQLPQLYFLYRQQDINNLAIDRDKRTVLLRVQLERCCKGRKYVALIRFSGCKCFSEVSSAMYGNEG